jgi:NADPH2:quinone reductase
MSRIVRLYRTGGPEQLQLEEATPEEPRYGEVRLKVQAIGLNNSEAQLRRGDYPLLKASFPTRIGRECSGIVEAVGPGVIDVAVGDEVSTIPTFDVQRNGIYGEWAMVPVEGLTKVPSNLNRLEAAAVWQQYLTVYGPFIEHASLHHADTVLITAAASSVGRGAIQVAKLLGCRVVATTRSPDKVRVLLEAGADRVVVSGEDLVGAVMAVSEGHGASLVFDPIAGPGILALAGAAMPGGLIVEYGQLATEPTPFPLVACMRKGLTIRGYTLWEITLNPLRREQAKCWIHDRLATGELRPVIDCVFPLDRIVEAHRYLESGRQTGKIIIDVASGARQ